MDTRWWSKKPEKSNYAKAFLRIAKYVVWLLCLYVSLSGFLSSYKFSKIYDLPVHEIITHIGDGSVLWSISENAENNASYRLHMLNGCELLETHSFEENKKIVFSKNNICGSVKILLMDDSGMGTLLEFSEDKFAVRNVDAGKYHIIAVGKWYCGKITVNVGG